MAAFTLTGLRVVREVAAHGSFTAAADALGYTQSAVSRQVALMEAAAAAPLFERLPRGVRPTAAGRVLLRHAAGVLDRVEAASLELGGLRDRLEGRLAVGAFPTALSLLVPRALARLGRVHPGLVVSLREGPTPTHLRRLRAGRIEVAVVAVGDGLPGYELAGLRTDLLLEGGLLLAVAEGHRFARRERVDVSELEHEPWIVGDSGGEGPDFGVWPGTPGRPRIAYAVRGWPGRLGLVAAGLGVATVPEMAVGTMPPGVRLVAVDEAHPIRRAALAVTLPERSPAATALVGALRDEAALLRATHRPAAATTI